MSIVERPWRKPHWVSGSITPATCVKSQLSITLAKILPPTDNSEMPRLLPQSARSPLFLYMATMLASFRCWGTGQVLQILQMKASGWIWRPFPLYSNTSAGGWNATSFVGFETRDGWSNFSQGGCIFQASDGRQRGKCCSWLHRLELLRQAQEKDGNSGH